MTSERASSTQYPKRTYCEQRTNSVHWLFSEGAGGCVVGLPNPGHKERDNGCGHTCVSSKEFPWTSRRRWTPRSPRSSAISARARSCSSARTTSRWRSRRSRPARSASTSRSASAACRAAASSRSTGRNRSGKTTLALHTVAEAQKKGGICAFVDAEHALDPIYARKLGVNVDDLLISQPDHRRAGAGDRRHAGALRRDRRAGGRFGRGAGAARRARRRDGRHRSPACRRA